MTIIDYDAEEDDDDNDDDNDKVAKSTHDDHHGASWVDDDRQYDHDHGVDSYDDMMTAHDIDYNNNVDCYGDDDSTNKDDS